MLLRNESVLTYGCYIHLYYDDNTELHTEVKPGDMLDILYNHNGIKENIIGKLIEIKPIIRIPVNTLSPCTCHTCNDIAQLVIDVSDKYQSNIQLVNIDTLLDLKIILPEEEEPILPSEEETPVEE